MISIIIPAHKDNDKVNVLLPVLERLVGIVSAEILIAFSPESETDFVKDDILNVDSIICKERGRASQMNEASCRAKGDILVFLHADVLPPKTFLLDIAEAINTGYEAGFFSYQFNSTNFWLKINASFTARDGFFTGGGDQCLFISKAVFVDLGRFNQEQGFMEDFEFFRKMKRKGVRYTIIENDLLVSARKYESNSYIRVNLSNMLLLLLFKLGCSGKRLKMIHDILIHPPNYG